MLSTGAGVAAAVVTSHFGFFKVVDKNLGRISRMQGKRCAFSFMSWKSYLLVPVMIAMGVALRHSPIPKPYLAVLYLGIGGGLMLSSIRYFRRSRRGAAVSFERRLTAAGAPTPPPHGPYASCRRFRACTSPRREGRAVRYSRRTQSRE